MRGVWRRLSSPDDVLALMDTSAEGVVACVADAGATFLAPIFDELTAVVCLSGTPLSHIGIVSREYQVPCVMSAVFASRRTGRRRRDRGRLQRRRTASCGGPRDRSARCGLGSRPMQRVVPLPQRDLVRADDAAHCARVRADSRHRVHRRRVRRVLPPLSRDGAGDRGRRAAGGPRARRPPSSRRRSTPSTCGRSRTSRCSAARCSRERACSMSTSEVAEHRAGPRLLGARRARLPVRRRHASGVGRRRRRDAVPRHVRGHRERMPAVARRRRARAHVAAQRARHVVPVPAVVRHALGLPGHRSVPPRRRADVAAPVVQPARRRRTSRGAARCRREMPYSDVLAAFVLDDASTSASPTSARR